MDIFLSFSVVVGKAAINDAAKVWAGNMGWSSVRCYNFDFSIISYVCVSSGSQKEVANVSF